MLRFTVACRIVPRAILRQEVDTMPQVNVVIQAEEGFTTRRGERTKAIQKNKEFTIVPRIGESVFVRGMNGGLKVIDVEHYPDDDDNPVKIAIRCVSPYTFIRSLLGMDGWVVIPGLADR